MCVYSVVTSSAAVARGRARRESAREREKGGRRIVVVGVVSEGALGEGRWKGWRFGWEGFGGEVVVRWW